MSKLDLAIVIVAFAGGTALIEQAHRVVIDAPVAAAEAAATLACPANDAVPYSARCLDFLNISSEPTPRLRVMPASFAPTAACPNNDGVPYSAGCLAFLRGATDIGMRWRINDDTSVPSFRAPE